jgi:enamine deaminase RidA (YjgF/YER057c/UK114 family)
VSEPGRRRAHSGSPFEGPYGFCRAIRVDRRVIVSGTAPVWADGSVDPDPSAQARRCCEIIVTALAELGAGPEDVVRTRMFVTDPAIADAVGAIHGEFFAQAQPAATMVVVAALIDARWLVEIEAEALTD